MKDIADAGFPLLPDDPAVNKMRELLGMPPADLEAAARDAALLTRILPEPEVPDPAPED